MSTTDKLLASEELDSFAKAYVDQGGNVVGTYCCHMPEELLYAANLLPYRLRATGCRDDSGAETYLSSFSCSFVRACLQHFIDGNREFLDGVVGSDGCLMAQRLYDTWKHLYKDGRFYHQFNTPRVTGPRAENYFQTEIRELMEALEKYYQVSITDEKLWQAIEVYNQTRSLIQQLYGLCKGKEPRVTGEECLRIMLAAMSMRKDTFNEMLSAFLEEAKQRKPITNYKARLMLVGSALDDPEYVKIFEKVGGLVVTDVHCFGSSYQWDMVERVSDDPVECLAKMYLNRPACPRMCNMHGQFCDHILARAKEYMVDGVVFMQMKNCDVWGGEGYNVQAVMKDAGIPLLVLEREEIVANAGQVGVRAEAFLEMLEKEENN